jgi:hypothetical protein
MDFIIYIAAAALCVVAALHIYWAFGGKLLTGAVIPTTEAGEPIFKPGFAATLAVAVFLLIGAMVLVKHNLSPSKLTVGLTMFYAAVFFIRGIGDFKHMGLFKKIAGTDFGLMDTLIFTPLVFILSFIFIYNLTL